MVMFNKGTEAYKVSFYTDKGYKNLPRIWPISDQGNYEREQAQVASRAYAVLMKAQVHWEELQERKRRKNDVTMKIGLLTPTRAQGQPCDAHGHQGPRRGG